MELRFFVIVLAFVWYNFLPVNPQRNGNKIEKGHFFLFFLPHNKWHVELPQPGMECIPFQWKRRVLTTEPPGKYEKGHF